MDTTSDPSAGELEPQATAEPQAATEPRGADGDASEHLEDLVVDASLLRLPAGRVEGNTRFVELVGQHLRLSGKINIGSFSRLSDYLNANQNALIELDDVLILRRNGEPTRVKVPNLWVSLDDVTILAELVEAPRTAPPELVHARDRKQILVVTPGHTLTGEVHLAPGAELSLFIESSDPHFLPMTDVRTRSLADRRVIERYSFALLNRRHIVATAALPPGMAAGKRVL